MSAWNGYHPQGLAHPVLCGDSPVLQTETVARNLAADLRSSTVLRLEALSHATAWMPPARRLPMASNSTAPLFTWCRPVETVTSQGSGREAL